MKSKGICVAGNLIVDVTYPISGWPAEGELTTITGPASKTVGGAVVNCAIDLSVMDEKVPVKALGVVGCDADGDFILDRLTSHGSIDVSMISRAGETSFTAVMSDDRTKTRSFFQYRGANAALSEDHFDFSRISCDILHVGYILLLDGLDREDREFGTVMARVLNEAQKRGIVTSVDVVTETGDRLSKLVPPALKYADLCVINELEAAGVTGVALRGADGELIRENMRDALLRLKEFGVSTWTVIHAPEGAWGLDERGTEIFTQSVKMDPGAIKGTVGAGDAFCSGILYGAWRGWDLGESMELAVRAAAASLTEKGATEGVRPVDDLRRMF